MKTSALFSIKNLLNTVLWHHNVIKCQNFLKLCQKLLFIKISLRSKFIWGFLTWSILSFYVGKYRNFLLFPQFLSQNHLSCKLKFVRMCQQVLKVTKGKYFCKHVSQHLSAGGKTWYKTPEILQFKPFWTNVFINFYPELSKKNSIKINKQVSLKRMSGYKLNLLFHYSFQG